MSKELKHIIFDGEAVISALCAERFLWKLILWRGERESNEFLNPFSPCLVGLAAEMISQQTNHQVASAITYVA